MESDAEVTDEEETDKADEPPKEKKTKTVTNTVWEWETINSIQALWMREKSDIEEREYNDFYKTIAKDHQDPLSVTHFSAEGEIEFKSILGRGIIPFLKVAAVFTFCDGAIRRIVEFKIEDFVKFEHLS